MTNGLFDRLARTFRGLNDDESAGQSFYHGFVRRLNRALRRRSGEILEEQPKTEEDRAMTKPLSTQEAPNVGDGTIKCRYRSAGLEMKVAAKALRHAAALVVEATGSAIAMGYRRLFSEKGQTESDNTLRSTTDAGECRTQASETADGENLKAKVEALRDADRQAEGRSVLVEPDAVPIPAPRRRGRPPKNKTGDKTAPSPQNAAKSPKAAKAKPASSPEKISKATTASKAKTTPRRKPKKTPSDRPME